MQDYIIKIKTGCSSYFFKCPSVIKEIEATSNKSGLTANIGIKESNIMLGLYRGQDLEDIFNIIIFFSKWNMK